MSSSVNHTPSGAKTTDAACSHTFDNWSSYALSYAAHRSVSDRYDLDLHHPAFAFLHLGCTAPAGNGTDSGVAVGLGLPQLTTGERRTMKMFDFVKRSLGENVLKTCGVRFDSLENAFARSQKTYPCAHPEAHLPLPSSAPTTTTVSFSSSRAPPPPPPPLLPAPAPPISSSSSATPRASPEHERAHQAQTSAWQGYAQYSAFPPLPPAPLPPFHPTTQARTPTSATSTSARRSSSRDPLHDMFFNFDLASPSEGGSVGGAAPPDTDIDQGDGDGEQKGEGDDGEEGDEGEGEEDGESSDTESEHELRLEDLEGPMALRGGRGWGRRRSRKQAQRRRSSESMNASGGRSGPGRGRGRGRKESVASVATTGINGSVSSSVDAGIGIVASPTSPAVMRYPASSGFGGSPGADAGTGAYTQTQTQSANVNRSGNSNEPLRPTYTRRPSMPSSVAPAVGQSQYQYQYQDQYAQRAHTQELGQGQGQEQTTSFLQPRPQPRLHPQPQVLALAQAQPQTPSSHQLQLQFQKQQAQPPPPHVVRLTPQHQPVCQQQARRPSPGMGGRARGYTYPNVKSEVATDDIVTNLSADARTGSTTGTYKIGPYGYQYPVPNAASASGNQSRVPHTQAHTRSQSRGHAQGFGGPATTTTTGTGTGTRLSTVKEEPSVPSLSGPLNNASALVDQVWQGYSTSNGDGMDVDIDMGGWGRVSDPLPGMGATTHVPTGMNIDLAHEQGSGQTYALGGVGGNASTTATVTVTAYGGSSYGSPHQNHHQNHHQNQNERNAGQTHVFESVYRHDQQQYQQHLHPGGYASDLPAGMGMTNGLAYGPPALSSSMSSSLPIGMDAYYTSPPMGPSANANPGLKMSCPGTGSSGSGGTKWKTSHSSPTYVVSVGPGHAHGHAYGQARQVQDQWSRTIPAGSTGSSSSTSGFWPTSDVRNGGL